MIINIKFTPKQISFFPESGRLPKLPARNTLAFQALLLLLKGKKISHPDFEDKTASWRLAAHIHTLTKLGWPVQVVDVKHYTTKKPKNRRISQYFLSHDVVEKLKEVTDEVQHG
jgi:hypothetical protein